MHFRFGEIQSTPHHIGDRFSFGFVHVENIESMFPFSNSVKYQIEYPLVFSR